MLSSLVYLWHSGYLHQGTVEELRNQFLSNKKEPAAESEVKPVIETPAAVPQPDAALSDQKPTTKGESHPTAQSSELVPNTPPPAAQNVPASKPVNR